MARTDFSQTDCDVLIVGAGPAGLTLAIDMARRGVSALLIEKRATPALASKGKGIQPRSLEVFHNLGVIDNVMAEGRPYPRLRFHEAGSVPSDFDMMAIKEPTRAVPYPNTIMLPQWALENILRARLAALGGRVQFGTSLVWLEPRADHVRVTVEEADGTRIVTAKYVVGADGGHSTVRQLSGIALIGDSPNLDGMIVADVMVDGLDRDFWHFWKSQAGRAVGLCPLTATEHFQLTASISPEEQPDLTLHALNALLEEAEVDPAVHFQHVDWVSVFRPNIRMAETFRKDRVFIVGDAAHVHPSAGAQGMNTSVQDAFNLGWKLAAVLGGAEAALLDTFEEERFPVAADVLERSGKLYRDGVARGSTSMRRGDDEQQLLLNYRGTSLCAGEGSDTLQPGDRMPDGMVTDGSGMERRLFDVMSGPHATLLCAGVPSVTAGNGTRIVLSDADEFGVTGYISIRPDMYVGSISPHS
ncbi:MAG: FAD-dependent monooxygenase [Parvibaculum sp.]|nr:FAD-dependent monooxygenase [Parvibaculum sp.]|tara:strand:+ start:5190 stop:6605 length:1416 start_codon:yes stop_codon:yes gene_type:complete